MWMLWILNDHKYMLYAHRGNLLEDILKSKAMDSREILYGRRFNHFVTSYYILIRNKNIEK